MTKIEAIKIFNLQPGFTIEELKKNYNQLIMKWMPNGYNRINSFDNVQRINEAYILLEEDFVVSDILYTDLDKSKKDSLDDLMKYLGLDLCVDYDLSNMDDLTKSVFYMLLNYYYQARLDIEKCESINELYNIYLSYSDKMIAGIEEYIINYCNIHKIKYTKVNSYEYSVNDKSINIEYGITSVYLELSRSKKLINRVVNKVKKYIKEFSYE